MRTTTPTWVESEDGCHIWDGARSPEGYARVKYKGRNQYVHRLRYLKEVGPIPPRARLVFTCKNGMNGCCNPAHCVAVVPASIALLGSP